MGNSRTRMLAALMAAMLLILQFAGSSPVLHEFLHGHGDAVHACDKDEAPHNPADDGLSGHVCGVMLLAGGVALSTGFSLAAFQPTVVGTVPDAAPAKVFPSTWRYASPRAPPVS